MIYEEKLTRLYVGEMNANDVRDVALWSVSPPWHKLNSYYKDATIYERWEHSSATYDRTVDGGVMVLWVPLSSIHRYPFNPNESGQWSCCGTILSGDLDPHIGYVYRKGSKGLPWRMKIVEDTRGARASSSSKTVKVMLDEFVQRGQTVVEPYAHTSAVLPIWCRRSAISYVGYCKSKRAHDYMTKKLAQIELPGIQLTLPGA